MSRRSTAVTVGLCAAIATPLAAQSALSAPRWSVQAAGIALGLFGSEYEGLGTGYGGELQVRLTPSRWSYGVGVQTSSHDLTLLSGSSMALRGVFVEPRRTFDIGSARYAPYLAARLAYLRQSADVSLVLAQVRRPEGPIALAVLPSGDVSLQTSGGANTSITASGFQGNVGGGVLVTLTPRVHLDLGLTVGAIRFGDSKLTVNGSEVGTFDGTTGTEQNAVLRIGVAIGLGGRTTRPR